MSQKTLNKIDKKILGLLYIAQLTNQKSKTIFKKMCLVYDNDHYYKIIADSTHELEKNGMITQNGNDDKKITSLGIKSLKIVLAGGVFDIIHPGHVHTLHEAKKLGDVLVVVIATDKTALKMKKRNPLHNQNQRKLLVDTLEIVDVAIIGSDKDIFKTVDLIKPQIVALGYDQIHQEKTIVEGCKKINLNVRVARLQSPIPETSSSIIEKKYGDQIHGT